MRRTGTFIALAALLLAGACSKQAIRVVKLSSGQSRIETPLYSLVVPTDEGWTIQAERGMEAIWLYKEDPAGKAMSLGLVVMEAGVDAPGGRSAEELASRAIAELEKLAQETATMGRFTRAELDREPVEIGGRRFFRTVCAEHPGGDPAAEGARVSGSYLWFPGDAAPAHYLLINLRDDAAAHVADSRLLDGELPAMLRTLRPRSGS